MRISRFGRHDRTARPEAARPEAAGSTGRALARYSLIQVVGKFLPGLVGFAVAAALTRLLAPEEYGNFGLAMAMAQMLALAAFAWLGLSITRLATGRPKDPRLAAAVLAVFLTIAAASILCSAAVFLLPGGGGYARLAIAGAFGGVVLAWFDVRSAFLAAALNFTGYLKLNLTRATIYAAVAIAAAYWFRSGLAVFAASGGAMLAACWLFPNASPARLAIDRPSVRRLCAFGLPIAGSLVLFAMAGWTDRLVLGLQGGAAAVGFYAAAATIVQNTLQLAASAIDSAAYPLAVIAFETGGHAATVRQLQQNLVTLLTLIVPAASGLCLLAPTIAQVLVGADYRTPVVTLTPLLAAAALIYAIRGNFVDHLFHLTGHTRPFLWIALVMAGVNLATLLLLVPLYGYLGAGIANLATAAAGLAHASTAARRIYAVPLPVREIAKILLAAALMTAGIEGLPRATGAAGLILEILAGAAIYGAAAAMVNLLDLRRAAMALLFRRMRPSPVAGGPGER